MMFGETEEPEKALFAMSEADYQVSYQIDHPTQVFVSQWPLVVSFISTTVGTKKNFRNMEKGIVNIAMVIFIKNLVGREPSCLLSKHTFVLEMRVEK